MLCVLICIILLNFGGAAANGVKKVNLKIAYLFSALKKCTILKFTL